ncbi:MAG: cupin domain-containing protein [Actinomycetota bacterium]|nr:cupin domain-containing protein [Actinomycetota bacterium]
MTAEKADREQADREQNQLARLFPAGTSVSHLAVYDWSSPDGLRGGSAHVHLACTEGYVVVGGRGRLQTLGPDGYAETPLTPLTVAWFSPGVIHRLVNDADLQIVVVMQNSGLPEAGDCVLTFPSDHLEGPEAYSLAASLADPERVYATDGEAAEKRKNLAVEGFLALRERFETEGPSALEEFYAAAAALTRSKVPAWRDTWEAGPLAAAQRTGEQLAALADGEHRHLHEGRLTVSEPPSTRKYGMCGKLATYATSRTASATS